MKALQGNEQYGTVAQESMEEHARAMGVEKMSLLFMGRDRSKSWGVLFCLKQGSIFSENHRNTMGCDGG